MGLLSLKASFHRARSPEHKEQRRTSILEAAAALLDDSGLEGVTLSAIARRAGLAKSNVYRYFESREAILLHIFEEEWKASTEALELELSRPPEGGHTPETVAALFVGELVSRPRLCALLSVLSSVVERNLSEEAVYAFKSKAHRLGLRGVNALHAALPRLTVQNALHFLTAAISLAGGLWPAAHPPEVVARVLERPELQVLRVDFEPTLSSAIAAMLRGYTAG